MQEALFYTEKENGKAQCVLCPHECIISPGGFGICGVRYNRRGLLYTKTYGQISSLGVDPIEKKPLYHFYPGSKILSIGTYGCNFSCCFCQNHHISQNKPILKSYTSEKILSFAERENSIGIAYTYSEPVVWYEFIRKTGELAHAQGLKNVMITNGYINLKPLEKLLPYIDAFNIDLKSFSDKFYEKLCGGSLKPVLKTISRIAESKNTHLELTTLVITDFNDQLKELKELFKWIADLDCKIPLHLSRYFPHYKLDVPATSYETMRKAYELAQKYLDYVYIGNINTGHGSDTFCPECRKKLIERRGYQINNYLTDGGCCHSCGQQIQGVFK